MDDGSIVVPPSLDGDLDQAFVGRFTDIFGDDPDGGCDEPLELAADLAVDALITAARKAAEDNADAAVVARLEDLGICGEAAISLIVGSVEAVADVAEEVLGVGHTPAAAAALQRVWLRSTLPGRRQLTELSRRPIPPTRLPPGTRVTAAGRVPVTKLQADGGGERLDAAPEAMASGRFSGSGKKSAAALTAATHVFLASTSSPKRPRKNPPPPRKKG